MISLESVLDKLKEKNVEILNNLSKIPKSDYHAKYKCYIKHHFPTCAIIQIYTQSKTEQSYSYNME